SRLAWNGLQSVQALLESVCVGVKEVTVGVASALVLACHVNVVREIIPTLRVMHHSLEEDRGLLGCGDWEVEADGPSTRHSLNGPGVGIGDGHGEVDGPRSEEHTSELQSRENLVC